MSGSENSPTQDAYAFTDNRQTVGTIYEGIYGYDGPNADDLFQFRYLLTMPKEFKLLDEEKDCNLIKGIFQKCYR